MTPRERVLATIDRKPVDRPPVDLWCTPEVLDSLRRYTGQSDELDVFQSLGLDKIVWLGVKHLRETQPGPGGNPVNMWGVSARVAKAGQATYWEIDQPPLADFDDPAQLDDFPWPDPKDYDFSPLRSQIDRVRKYHFATLGPWVSHFEIYCQMRGLENAMMDLLSEPDFVDAALDRIDAIQTALLERFFAEAADGLDMVFISDDMGSQKSLLISLPAWDAFFRDRLKNWCDLVHRHGKKVFYHSDGAVRDLVPRLIECGIDILNPIQHVCPGMDRAALKKDFGDKVIFHGGVDNQHALPFGSPKDVAHEVRECLETLGHGGGYICCSCHNVQAGTPVENVLAMIATAQQA